MFLYNLKYTTMNNRTLVAHFCTVTDNRATAVNFVQYCAEMAAKLQPSTLQFTH